MKTITRFGRKFSVDKNLNLILSDGTVISNADMKAYAEKYKGVNRIYKPIALLFWTDVKNGKASDWELDKPIQSETKMVEIFNT
jgi:hypothetical protein